MNANETVNLKLATLKMGKKISNYKMSNRKGIAIIWLKNGERRKLTYGQVIKNF